MSRQKDLKYPFALDEDGNPVLPHLARFGVLYKCGTCNDARLGRIANSRGRDFFKTLDGEHTGKECGCGLPMVLVDVDRIVANSTHKEGKLPPIEKGPYKPRKPKEKVVVGSNLEKIREYRFMDLEDFTMDNGSRLTDHIVSAKNTHVVLNDNTALGNRVLVAVPWKCYDWRNTITFLLKAFMGENGKPTAGRMFIDFYCDDTETYQEACKMYFVRYWNEVKQQWNYYPRYKQAYITGKFEPVPYSECRKKRACFPECEGEFVHCVGRQRAKLVRPEKQINVSEDEKEDISFFNGWTEQL